MAYGLCIPSDVMAADVNSKVRSVKASATIEQGNVFNLNALTGTAGEREVWAHVIPTTGNLSNLWMACEPELITTASKYRNLDPNVLNYQIASGETFTAFKPEIGDVIVLNADAIAGSIGANTFVVAVNNDYFLTWAAAAVSGLSLKLLATEYVSIPTLGTIGDSQRTVTYRFAVVAVA